MLMGENKERNKRKYIFDWGMRKKRGEYVIERGYEQIHSKRTGEENITDLLSYYQQPSLCPTINNFLSVLLTCSLSYYQQPSLKFEMTEAMTPISTDALHCRTLLMNQLLYLSTRLMRYECILLPYLEKLLTGLNRYGYMWIQFTQSVNRSHSNTKELVLMRYMSQQIQLVQRIQFEVSEWRIEFIMYKRHWAV